jgi:hypothetical protein
MLREIAGTGDAILGAVLTRRLIEHFVRVPPAAPGENQFSAARLRFVKALVMSSSRYRSAGPWSHRRARRA